VDIISEALKVRLLNDIKGMNLSSELPHIPFRRVGEGRLTGKVYDILSMFTYLDEAKAMDNLPTYVTTKPDNIPSRPPSWIFKIWKF